MLGLPLFSSLRPRPSLNTSSRPSANGVRLRLMRLSEAAEKLQRQASADVRFGKENEARELLIQKRKVMQALDKSKGRIELCDKLLAKLNEAIAVKKTTDWPCCLTSRRRSARCV
ncbi:hypothetical protein QJS10_CPA03g00695 [Acorus calamus]|uniref:Tubulin-specific chaperone A n=1 Tax=Acorus calamus TaxID=4465 RepID=A0AAV9F9P7_ACOCL|nr:hypothetical protein QJS10_CPA03g00695 [Acorus calamus]